MTNFSDDRKKAAAGWLARVLQGWGVGARWAAVIAAAAVAATACFFAGCSGGTKISYEQGVRGVSIVIHGGQK